MASLFAAFENVEQLVARTVTEAASAVVESTSEYPKPSTEPARHARLAVPISAARAAQVAAKAQTSWEDFDWQHHQQQWQEALEQLQHSCSPSSASAASFGQRLQDLYQQLLALPDPVPALQDAAALTSKTKELEEINRKLQQEAQGLQQDQVEVTQLLADYRAEQAAHNSLQAAHKALQEELSAVREGNAEADHWKQQAQEHADTMRSLQATISSMKSELEASQTSLFELTERQELVAGSANTAEQLAVEEVERLSVELLDLRKEKALLERQLQQVQEQSRSDSNSSAPQEAQHVEGLAAAADTPGRHPQQQQHAQTAATHERQLADAKAALAAAEAAALDQQHQVTLLSSKLAGAEARLERMAAELKQRPAASAVAAVVEQLAALSALTGKQLESEGWGSEIAAAAVAALTSDPTEHLAPLVQERCTKLEGALQAARTQAATALESATATAAEVQHLRQQLQQSQQLVQQLEQDVVALSSCNTTSSMASAAALGNAAAREAVFQGIVGAEELSISGQVAVEAASLAGSEEASKSGDDGSAALLQVITAQRDRFKARIGQLEAEQALLTVRLQEVQVQVDTVTQDNVALVEKIRFLERYKHSPGLNTPDRQGSVTVIRVDGAGVIQDVAAGFDGAAKQSGANHKSSRYRCGPLSLDLPTRHGTAGSNTAPFKAEVGNSRRRHRQAGCFGMLVAQEAQAAGGWGPEERYTQEYEARLNPFAEFKASESNARLKGMRLHDHALLAGSRLIAGSKLARAAIAVYVLLLHAVIMALMYYSATPHMTLSESATSSSAPSAVEVTQAVLGAAGHRDAASQSLQQTAAAAAAPLSNRDMRLML